VRLTLVRIEESKSKGDPQKILEFLNTHCPLSEDSAKKMTAELEKGRKRAIQRNISIA